MLNWVNRFNIFCYLDNHQYSITPNSYECLLAAGAFKFIDESSEWHNIDQFLSDPHWTFGHLSYDLKDRLFPLATKNKRNKIDFPDFFFFNPEILITLQSNEITITAEEPQIVFDQVLSQELNIDKTQSPVALKQRLGKEEYVQKIHQLQKRILRGDCYEINFCQEFFSENVSLDAVAVFQKLTAVSPTPFSALYRLENKYLICASPERFLAKKGNKIFSQPMKGTARRSLQDAKADEQIKKDLLADAKERAENVMVVDLVRNDLSKICKDSTVKVNELFGVYTFPQVHQMVSTISGDLKDNLQFSDIIAATFPMGSMTGAPKFKVMQLIDQYETEARGLFSGSVGYFDPTGNFDFNVVIRSILYNADNKYLSYQTGSGITFYSDPEKEWEECLLKGEAIKKVLTG
jgi:para-aminobenzoate synthetase component 1